MCVWGSLLLQMPNTTRCGTMWSNIKRKENFYRAQEVICNHRLNRALYHGYLMESKMNMKLGEEHYEADFAKIHIMSVKLWVKTHTRRSVLSRKTVLLSKSTKWTPSGFTFIFSCVCLLATNAPARGGGGMGGSAFVQVHSLVISASLPNPHPMLGHLPRCSRDSCGATFPSICPTNFN